MGIRETVPGYILGIAISTLPVVVFLVSLVVLDGYKLVRRSSIVRTIAAGVAVALLGMVLNRLLLSAAGWDVGLYTRSIAPPIEEILKGAFLVWLMATKRVGFMVDAAICGFALGTGFAIVENIYYVNAFCDASIALCVLRGFGTALMHGGATAIFGIVTKSLSERYGFARAWIYLPGLGVAIVIHTFYNHFILSPAVSVLGVVLALPALMYFVFRQGERVLRNWLGVGFDTDAELLEMIESGGLSGSRIGEYLSSLRDRFPREVVADMMNLLGLRVELSIRAKGILLMREAGFDPKPAPDIREKFNELRYLEESIGKTGHLAMMPLLHWRDRDLWELHMLGKR